VDLKGVFLRVLIASLLATAGLAIGFLLLADFNERTWKVIATTALLSASACSGCRAPPSSTRGVPPRSAGQISSWLRSV